MREERRQHADEEHAAPAPDRHDDQVDRAPPDRSRSPTSSARTPAPCRDDAPGTSRRPAPRRWPTRRPCRSPSRMRNTRQLRDRLRQAARRGEHRVDQHRRHQRALAADAIGDDAEGHAARRGREQRDGAELSRHRGRQLQHRILDQRRQDQRVEHHVERVEHPAQRGGDEGAARPGVGVVPPGERALPPRSGGTAAEGASGDVGVMLPGFYSPAAAFRRIRAGRAVACDDRASLRPFAIAREVHDASHVRCPR